MKISTGIEINDNRFFILYEDRVCFRLRTTCFRGTYNKLAGNFLRWNSFSDLVYDTNFDFVKSLSESVERTYEECLKKNADFGNGVVTLDFEEEIGWESTNERYKYHNDKLEEFKLNDRSVALRVKTELKHIEAPKTTLVTIVYDILIENKDIIASIQTIYPGVYVGPLRNTEKGKEKEIVNITERQGRVFFDWNHPGE